MRNVVFEVLRSTALRAQQMLADPTTEHFKCKGCSFSYQQKEIFPVQDIGFICHGCITKISQMFLQ
jgi:hypothetical protein